MKDWFIRIILLAALAAVGYWAWGLFFPNPEKVIRKQLEALAKEVSFASNQGLMAQAWKATVLEGFFTPDVQVTINVPGTEHSITGRNELMEASLGARRVVSSLKIDLPDVKVTVAPDKESAVVNLTARGKVPGQQEFYLQELRLRLIKVKRDWLVNEIITVRTLS